MEIERQKWKEVENQIKKYYKKTYDNKNDWKIIKAFFEAGFNVYPESGHMFQRRICYEDGSYNHASISINEARTIANNLFQKQGK